MTKAARVLNELRCHRHDRLQRAGGSSDFQNSCRGGGHRQHGGDRRVVFEHDWPRACGFKGTILKPPRSDGTHQRSWRASNFKVPAVLLCRLVVNMEQAFEM